VTFICGGNRARRSQAGRLEAIPGDRAANGIWPRHFSWQRGSAVDRESHRVQACRGQQRAQRVCSAPSFLFFATFAVQPCFGLVLVCSVACFGPVVWVQPTSTRLRRQALVHAPRGGGGQRCVCMWVTTNTCEGRELNMCVCVCVCVCGRSNCTGFDKGFLTAISALFGCEISSAPCSQHGARSTLDAVSHQGQGAGPPKL
jgi:hypothetical protein